jgi:N-acetylneuraminic acid mutarotase
MTVKRLLALLLGAAALVGLAAAVGSFASEADEAAAAPWTRAQSMSQRRSYIAAAELGGQVYAAGGMVGETGRRLPTFQRFDPEADSWTTLSPLPEPIRAAEAAAVAGQFYVIGGDDTDGNGTDVYVYDPAADEWESRAPMPAPRFNHSAVAIGSKIYVLGGFGEGREHDDLFVYDTESDSWREAAPLPRPNHAFGAVVFRGEIWMIGGRRGEEILREVWVYNPRADRWRRGPSMPEGMELLGAAVDGDEIHAVWEHVYQIYDAETGEWRAGPRSLVTRHGLSVFAVDGSLYTIGGCTTDLHDSQVVERRDLRAR